MIKNIIFDLSEVIISGYHGMEYLMEQKYNVSVTEFEKRKQETIDIFLDTMRGNFEEDDYWNEFLKETNWNITIEDLKITIRENLNRAVKGTMEIVKQLKKENYQLILVSDHVREWMKYIDEQNQDIKIFKKRIFSYEIGSIKSDEQTFRELLKKTPMLAEETLFIDDLEINVKRAEEVGIYGIVFKNANQLREELKQKYAIQIN